MNPGAFGLWSPWLKPLLGFVSVSVAGFLASFFILKPLSRLFEKTQTPVDDMLYASVRRHFPFWFVLAGVALATRVSPLEPVWISRVDRVLMVFFVLSVSFAVSSFSVVFIRAFAGRLAIGATTLLENLARLAVFSMGLLLILSNLGISIAPLLTALGVGSLAVALALQDTLSNLFAGIYIILNRRVRVGDFIKLDSGETGHVIDISWRATCLRDRTDSLVLIPNTKLAQATVTNFHLPEREMTVVVEVGAAYGGDLKKIERVVQEVARQVQQEVHGAVPQFEPFARYHAFGDSAVQMTIALRVREYEDQFTVKHEFVKRLHDRFAHEGIEIPFPQRVVRMAGKE